MSALANPEGNIKVFHDSTPHPLLIGDRVFEVTTNIGKFYTIFYEFFAFLLYPILNLSIAPYSGRPITYDSDIKFP
jgi:hypothetical protein